jgi:hypothetical protein
MSSSRSRGPFALLIRVAAFFVVFMAVGEVWFSTAMHACEWPVGMQRDPVAVARYDPSGPNPGLFTSGRLCRRGAEWRVNQEGWVSAIPYLPAQSRRRPLVALVGDSYIEGLLTDPSDHVDAYLPSMLPGTAAYSFGLSSWYLEQYVAVSRYVRDRFHPDALVVFIDEDDVADSLQANGTSSPSWWQVRTRGAAFEEVPPTGVKSRFSDQSASTRLLRLSALVRYVQFNALVTVPTPRAVVDRLLGRSAPADGTNESGAAHLASGRDHGAGVSEAATLAAADFMVGRLCSDNPGTPIVFVAHRQPSPENDWDTSDRYLQPEDLADEPLFADGRMIQAACEGRPQCAFIDLRYAFSRDWKAHHIRFESDDGAHWNAYANRLVARELADFYTKKGVLASSR